MQISIAVEFKAWVSNCIHVKLWNVITHPYSNFDSSFDESLLKWQYGSLIIFHRNFDVWLLIHALISDYVSRRGLTHCFDSDPQVAKCGI